MASRKKKQRVSSSTSQLHATHIVSIPIATSLLYGSREQALKVFSKHDITTMNKMMAACVAFHKTRHFQLHDTELIGRAPPTKPGAVLNHPWGTLTFGIVRSSNGVDLKKCIVSCIHHRKTLSPEDALVKNAETLPWDELPEISM